MSIVLLVENDKEEAQVYIRSLKNVGFEIIHITNAEGIERIVTEQKVDVIVSDTNLDGSYGDEICSELLTKGKLEVVLVIGMSTALEYGDYWTNIAHEFIHKRALNDFYDLGQIVLELHRRFKQNPNILRYKENPLIARFKLS